MWDCEGYVCCLLSPADITVVMLYCGGLERIGVASHDDAVSTHVWLGAWRVASTCGLTLGWDCVVSASDQVTCFWWNQQLSRRSSSSLPFPNAHPPATVKLDRFSVLLRHVRRGMAAAEKTSFLGSLSPWSGVSRSATPSPSRAPKPPPEQPTLPSTNDHSVTLRPFPSLRTYPTDCPPLKSRWYYAVDAPKRKPFAADSEKLSAPKKLVPFSANDSQAIEKAFQELGNNDNAQRDLPASSVTR